MGCRSRLWCQVEIPLHSHAMSSDVEMLHFLPHPSTRVVCNYSPRQIPVPSEGLGKLQPLCSTPTIIKHCPVILEERQKLGRCALPASLSPAHGTFIRHILMSVSPNTYADLILEHLPSSGRSLTKLPCDPRGSPAS
jgi:hypothetical protein